MSQIQNTGDGKIKLTFLKKMSILWPYISHRFKDQLNSVWIIIAYLLLFQIVILDLPIVFSLMIAFGVFIVIIGLMFFMEGLVLGLMPLGEIIGVKLPMKSTLTKILLFSFLLGVVATFAEPAIAVLKLAGENVKPFSSPLLYSLLNEFSGQLVFTVAIGVGIAVMLGILRFMYGWSLKYFIVPLIIMLTALTVYAHFSEILNPIIGLAWDCGAVTTGPVTVPLILALGIGVCRVVNSGDSGIAGFGVVTLASLLPVLAVFLLGLYHYNAEDYYGSKNSQFKIVEENVIPVQKNKNQTTGEFSVKEVEEFKTTGKIEGGYAVEYKSDSIMLSDGKIIITNPKVIYTKSDQNKVIKKNIQSWDKGINMLQIIADALINALIAIVPLCLFLYFVLRFVLHQSVPHADEVALGIFFAFFGLGLFGLGISLGLTPLGSQLGTNIPSAFAKIQPWGLQGYHGSLYGEGFSGKFVSIIFGFFLGYAATLAEPALITLGETVEKITVGSFKKSLLMQTVAIGVAIGIAFGVFQFVYAIPLSYFLIPLSAIVLILTIRSSEVFVNIGWDSAGVTTGPITVPLVLAMGLGIGANIPGIIGGFGILAIASLTPIIAVLFVGMIVVKAKKTQYI